MDAQVKKGLIDICVLAVLAKGDTYGWQIIKELESVVEISESTLYPILKRLVASEMAEPYEIPHNGRLRKYFRIRRKGKQRLRDFENEQEKLMKIYDYIKEAIHD